MPDLHVVILAAGKGTRMKSAVPKVLHRLAGRPMLDYVLRTAATLEPQTITLVVGHLAETIKRAIGHLPDLPCSSRSLSSARVTRCCRRPA